MSRKLIIIGASELQNPLILKAKKMGYETHVFAWQCGDIGEATADHFYPISIREKEKILEACRAIQPDGVVSIASDLAAVTVNYVANALSLPANPPITARIATNKYDMREAFAKAHIKTPGHRKVKADADLRFVEKMALPVIVKPTDRSGSRGIFKIEDLSDLKDAVQMACAQSFEQCAIVEEFINGAEYSCESISQDGHHHCLALTRKVTTGAPHFIEVGHVQPAGIDEESRKKIIKQIHAALDALQIRCGASHAEFKYDADTGDFGIIEIGARMGGDCIGSDLVPLSTGADFVKMTIQASVGETIDLPQTLTAKPVAVRYLFNENDIRHFERLQAAHPECIYRSYVAEHREASVTDSSTRLGFYIVRGETNRIVCEYAGLPERAV